jgi:hypothetical protein
MSVLTQNTDYFINKSHFEKIDIKFVWQRERL